MLNREAGWPYGSPQVRAIFVMVTLGALLAGCATSSRPTSGSGTRVVPADAVGRRALADAQAFTGTAYRAGGADPTGFDCSGFVQYLYGRYGIALPRTASDQFRTGRRVQARRVAPGDLVFFRISGRRVSHVGVATGDGRFVHAPNVGTRVRIDRLDHPYWSRRFAGARRVTR